ncbi:hypothetical protein CFO_g2137 [Ceratocystis platani]|uniref:Uncharacterized protein n=1 Tax=Ceratocystis fimbriata f. sp. platani TaxID=88771 RepID=A0A0F8B2A7_CERFI|nr:hypothetical protein CFO_g2137 [Ceratocystis platani]
MDLDELPSAGLTDAHYENLELFPEVTRADSIAAEVPQFDTELVSSNTTASPAAFSTTASQLGDDLSNIAIDPKPSAAKKSNVKKKGAGIKKLPNGTGVTSMATKRPKATSGAKTSTTRRPKAKPSTSTSAPEGAAGAVEAEDSFTNSVFCSDEHCYQWWEQIVARLTPASTIPPAVIGKLSREDLLGVIASGLGYVDEATGTYKLAHEPFLAPVSKEESEDMHLSAEERSLLSKSADDRAELASEIELCSKMLQLADQVTERHKAAVASGFITNDICGYDSRIDSVGVQAAFAAFLQTEEGQASCAQGTLQAPKSKLAVIADMENEDDKERRQATAGMCDKKRCKAHQGWAAMFHKAVKNQIRQLTSQTADLLCEEEVIRAASLERYRRKKVEKNWVEAVGEETHVKQEEADKTIGDAMDLD